ncbi:MAG: nucleoside-diphosphate kinase [Lentisphaeria bacterium]|nr:nucleoside-diphosphate kinase [Lentisphaeria bacterium]
MALELSYVLITPYSLMKSRTGGIISRLLSRTGLELAGVQILAPTVEFSQRYAASICEQLDEKDPFAAKLFSDYIMENLVPLEDGTNVRVMMLLFRGEDACRKLSETVGSLLPNAKHYQSSDIIGETIRDTYADLVFNRDGSLNYFEPAVFTPSDKEASLQKLEIIADFAENSPNIVENTSSGKSGELERTLVLIKPENWREPSTKPGSIIDMFSRTALRIVGCKLHQMSVQTALDFYAPVKDNLRKNLAPAVAEKAKKMLEENFGINMGEESNDILKESVGKPYADEEFNKIIAFMSGYRPDEINENEYSLPGKVKCMALVYEGKDAVRKIREMLGPTDPMKAPGGTIRREFGHDVMVNAAQASDSAESFLRESNILEIGKNPVSAMIREYLQTVKK